MEKSQTTYTLFSDLKSYTVLVPGTYRVEVYVQNIWGNIIGLLISPPGSAKPVGKDYQLAKYAASTDRPDPDHDKRALSPNPPKPTGTSKNQVVSGRHCGIALMILEIIMCPKVDAVVVSSSRYCTIDVCFDARRAQQYNKNKCF